MKSSDPEAGDLREGSFLQTALTDTDRVVVVFDEEGQLRWWNQAVRDRSEATDAELEAMSVSACFERIVAAADREHAAAAINKLLECGTLTAELSLRGEDGEDVPFEFRGSSASVCDGTGYVVFGYEITDRLQHEQKVEELRSCTLDLMQTSSRSESASVAATASNEVIGAPLSGVFFLDADGEALTLAAAAHDYEDTFETEPRYERDGPDGSRSATVWGVFEEGTPLVIDDTQVYDALAEESPARSVIIHPLGEYGILIASSPEPYVFDATDEALVEILATSLKSSLDRVERESRLREQNEHLDEFASILSHDLRNPLNIAEGHLDLARDADDPTSNYDAIGRSLERIGTLVEDLLTLAREGKAAIDVQRVNLESFVNSCWLGVRTGDTELHIDLDKSISADESRLRQLFENLFRNVIEHAGSAEQTEPLRVTVDILDTGDGFFVADNGVGIPESERELVQSPGYTTESNGTGLGLSIVAEIADAHGWELRITEGADGGAKFEFHNVEWV